MVRWWTFVRERFEPISHLSMILLFFLGHWVVFRLTSMREISELDFFLLSVGTTAFFFKLRLYDEIKDYEVDLRINPTRPLARGLVKHSDLYAGILICILLELTTFGIVSHAGLVAVIFAIFYSLLMFKEFFIGPVIRPHLTTYAISHTVVSAFLSLALFSALFDELPWSHQAEVYFFALNSWCLFNIFEFGRKTFTSSEERGEVESYSKIFGRVGAVVLVLVMALASIYFLHQIEFFTTGILNQFFWGVSGVLTLIGLSYAFYNRGSLGKVYRGFSSAYIVLIYFGVVAGYWIKGV